MDYAIIRVGGKQYRVREGETLLVDRVRTDEGKTFSPDVLLGDGAAGDGEGARARARPQDPDRQVQEADGLQAPRGLPLRADAHRDLARHWPCTGEEGRGASEEAPAPVQAAAEAPEHDHVKGMPKGYEQMTVAQVADGAKTWNRPMLEAAVAYEEANAARKGALAALNSALKAKEDDA